MLTKIISGGQTGADRGGLDFAIKHGIPHGGWVPNGRLAEDGIVPLKYLMHEHPSPLYPPRTAANIHHSDGTILFNPGRMMERGSALTLELCYQKKKPFLIWAEGCDIAEWIKANNIKVLNVAGNRESKCPGINKLVIEKLEEALIKA
jgi:hypothetical protein